MMNKPTFLKPVIATIATLLLSHPAYADDAVAPTYIKNVVLVHDFAGDLNAQQAKVMYAAQGRIADTLFAARTTQAAWHDKPTWYAVSTNDRTTSPQLERFLAQRMKAQTIEIDSSHLSMLSHPDDMTKLILDAVEQHR